MTFRENAPGAKTGQDRVLTPESWPCYLLIALIRQAGHTSIAATLRKIKNTPTPTAHQTI